MTTSWIAPGSVERLVLPATAAMGAFGGYERSQPHCLPTARGSPPSGGSAPWLGNYRGRPPIIASVAVYSGSSESPAYGSLIGTSRGSPPLGRGSLARVLTPELTQDASASAFASYACEFERAGDPGPLHRLLFAEFAHVYARRSAREDGPDAPWPTPWRLGPRSPTPSSSRTRRAAPVDEGHLFRAQAGAPHRLRCLPRRILHRRKHRFGVPAGRWFGGELRGPFEERVLDPGARTRETLRRGAAGALLDQHLLSRVDHGPRLWSLFVLQMWLRQLERPPTPGLPPRPDLAIAERNPS